MVSDVEKWKRWQNFRVWDISEVIDSRNARAVRGTSLFAFTNNETL